MYMNTCVMNVYEKCAYECAMKVCVWYGVECMSKWGVRSGFLSGWGGGYLLPLGFGLPPFGYAENSCKSIIKAQ